MSDVADRARHRGRRGCARRRSSSRSPSAIGSCMAARIRPAGADRPGCHGAARALRSAGAAASAEQSCADPLAFSRATRSCRRLPASIRPSIAATARLPIIMPFRSTSTTRACGGTASTACRTNTSPTACAGRTRDRERPRHRRPSGQRRVDVRAVGRPQRREHDGLHGARRFADGHAVRAARSRRRALSVQRKAMMPARFRIFSIANAA